MESRKKFLGMALVLLGLVCTVNAGGGKKLTAGFGKTITPATTDVATHLRDVQKTLDDVGLHVAKLKDLNRVSAEKSLKTAEVLARAAEVSARYADLLVDSDDEDDEGGAAVGPSRAELDALAAAKNLRLAERAAALEQARRQAQRIADEQAERTARAEEKNLSDLKARAELIELMRAQAERDAQIRRAQMAEEEARLQAEREYEAAALEKSERARGRWKTALARVQQDQALRAAINAADEGAAERTGVVEQLEAELEREVKARELANAVADVNAIDWEGIDFDPSSLVDPRAASILDAGPEAVERIHAFNRAELEKAKKELTNPWIKGTLYNRVETYAVDQGKKARREIEGQPDSYKQMQDRAAEFGAEARALKDRFGLGELFDEPLQATIDGIIKLAGERRALQKAKRKLLKKGRRLLAKRKAEEDALVEGYLEEEFEAPEEEDIPTEEDIEEAIFPSDDEGEIFNLLAQKAAEEERDPELAEIFARRRGSESDGGLLNDLTGWLGRQMGWGTDAGSADAGDVDDDPLRTASDETIYGEAGGHEPVVGEITEAELAMIREAQEAQRMARHRQLQADVAALQREYALQREREESEPIRLVQEEESVEELLARIAAENAQALEAGRGVMAEVSAERAELSLAEHVEQQTAARRKLQNIPDRVTNIIATLPNAKEATKEKGKAALEKAEQDFKVLRKVYRDAVETLQKEAPEGAEEALFVGGEPAVDNTDDLQVNALTALIKLGERLHPVSPGGSMKRKKDPMIDEELANDLAALKKQQNSILRRLWPRKNKASAGLPGLHEVVAEEAGGPQITGELALDSIQESGLEELAADVAAVQLEQLARDTADTAGAQAARGDYEGDLAAETAALLGKQNEREAGRSQPKSGWDRWKFWKKGKGGAQ